MKCPKCVKAGKKSIVYEGGTVSTLMYSPPFYDEDGEYHAHDNNSHTTSYSCSNGHQWTETPTNKCPNPKCDFNKSER